jgi:large subunit ribosomal protein L20
MPYQPLKHKKVLKQVKGQYGRRKNTIRVAKQALEKAMQYAYRDSGNKKRNFRGLWIQRINAGAREHGMSYSQLMGLLKKNNIDLNRKVLADLAMNEPELFKSIVEKVK